MDRVALGLRMQQWHSSMSDPVYAVGSFYFADQVYPDKSVVEDALHSMEADIAKFRKMIRGEKVSQYNQHFGRMVDDLKKFAGYTNKQLRENITDLKEIISELQRFLKEDYK